MARRVNRRKIMVLAALGAAVFVLATMSPATLHASSFLQEALPAFTVKGVTPQEASARRAFDYLAPEKFPDYRPVLRISLEVDPKRKEFEVGEALRLTYSAGRDGYASLIDYGPDGWARLLARNRPVSAGFTYTFTGEAALPAGEDFARLVVSQIPLSSASLKSLMEYPFAHSRQVRHVLSEAWVRFTVAEISRFRDPFYRYPHTWGRRPASEGEYYFAQPYQGAVLTRGISFVSAARIFEEFGVDGPIDFWLLEPGDSVELRFEVGTGVLPAPNVHLLLFMAQDIPRPLSLFDSENAALTIEVNGFALTNGYRPRFAYLGDDNAPEVFELGDHLRYGANWIDLRVDGFSPVGVRLRRLELRKELDELYWIDDDMFGGR